MSELGKIVTSLRSFRSVSLAAVASYICKPKKKPCDCQKTLLQIPQLIQRRCDQQSQNFQKKLYLYRGIRWGGFTSDFHGCHFIHKNCRLNKKNQNGSVKMALLNQLCRKYNWFECSDSRLLTALEEFIMEAIAAIDLEARAIQHRRSKWRSSSVG